MAEANVDRTSHYISAYSTVSDDQAKQYLKNFDLGDFASLQELKGGLSNSNYRLRTTRGDFLLKVCDEKTAEELQLQIDVLNVLERHAFPSNRALPMKNGQQLFITPEEPGIPIRRIIIYTFLPGSNPLKPSIQIMSQIGQALAKMHSIPVSDFKQLPEFSMGISQMLPFCQSEAAAAGVESSDFVKRLTSYLPMIQELYKLDLPQALCHGDLFVENTVFQDGKLSGILDFEECCRESCMLDIAMTVVGCCYDDEQTLDLDLVQSLLQSYQQARPFSQAERSAFIDYLKYSLLAIAFWRFRQFNVRVPDPSRCNVHEPMIARLDQAERMTPKEVERLFQTQ